MHRIIRFCLLWILGLLLTNCQAQPPDCPTKTFRFANFDFKYPIKVGEAIQHNNLRFYNHGRFGHSDPDPANPQRTINALILSHNKVNKSFERMPDEREQDYYEEWVTDYDLALVDDYYPYDSLFTVLQQQFGPFKPIPAWDLNHSVVLKDAAPNGVVVYLARVNACLAVLFFNLTYLSPQKRNPKLYYFTRVRFYFALTDEEIIVKYNTRMEEKFK